MFNPGWIQHCFSVLWKKHFSTRSWMCAHAMLFTSKVCPVSWLAWQGQSESDCGNVGRKGKENTGNQQGQWQCDNNFRHTAFLAEEVFPHRTLSDQSQNTSICVSPVTQLNYVSSSKAYAGQEERERQKELWLFSVNTGSAVALWTVLRGSGCDTGQSRQLFHCDSELVGKSATSLIQFFLKSLRAARAAL